MSKKIKVFSAFSLKKIIIDNINNESFSLFNYNILSIKPEIDSDFIEDLIDKDLMNAKLAKEFLLLCRNLGKSTFKLIQRYNIFDVYKGMASTLLTSIRYQFNTNELDMLIDILGHDSIYLLYTQNITPELYKKIEPRFKLHLNLCKINEIKNSNTKIIKNIIKWNTSDNLYPEVIDSLISIIDEYKFEEIDYRGWIKISSCPNLSLEFIEKYIDNIFIDILSLKIFFYKKCTDFETINKTRIFMWSSLSHKVSKPSFKYKLMIEDQFNRFEKILNSDNINYDNYIGLSQIVNIPYYIDNECVSWNLVGKVFKLNRLFIKHYKDKLDIGQVRLYQTIRIDEFDELIK